MKKNRKLLYIAIAAFAAVAVLLIILYFVFFTNGNKKGNTEKEYPIKEQFSFLKDNNYYELPNNDIYVHQNEFKNQYLKSYEKSNYTIEDPFVVINPFMFSPQTALVMFKTEKEETVTVTLKGKHNDDIVTTFEAAKDHYLPIYGLYGKYDNKVIIKTQSGKQKELSLKVDFELEGVSNEVLENKIENSNGYFYFTTSSLGASTAAYDNYGEVRWFLNNGFTKGMTMLSNGNMLLSSVLPGPDVTSTNGVVEVDMFGFVHNTYTVEGGYHHDGYEMPNGNLIILTSDVNGPTIADYIVELDRKTGKVVKDWRLTDAVKKIDPSIKSFYPTWGWINSITYDEKSNCFLLSLRNENSVVALGYDSKEIMWILGESKYWSSKFDNYLIKGTGTDFIYPKGQHSVNVTKEGYISIFNNGYDAHNEGEVSCQSIRNNESHAILYDVNLVNKTASIVYKFGGNKYFSYALSSYTYSADGHTLFNSGWHLKEENFKNPDCTQFNAYLYDTFIIEFDENKNKLVELHINEGKFEAVRANIYKLEEQSVKKIKKDVVSNYTFGDITRHNTSDPSYEVLNENDILDLAKHETYDFTMSVSSSLLQVYFIDDSDKPVKLSFVSGDGYAYRYTIKEPTESVLKDVDLTELPDNKYYLFIEADGITYSTNQYVIVNNGITK